MPKEKPEWRLRLDQCDEIMEAIDDLPERAEDFAISAAETVHDIAEWVQANKHITPRQCTALDNIQDGVAKWSN